MAAYYNDSDPFCAQWLRNLIAAGAIPGGYVDERSIAEVEPGDLRGFAQVHFFAGIGGWAYALQLARWDMDRPVWTGSCPCQPFSSAGRQGGALDQRHLWPRWLRWLRLIRECRPDAVLGEQVEGAVGFGWVDRVFADLEDEGYATGAAVLGAHSVGAPHIRHRLFWVADADAAGSDRQRRQGLSSDRDAPHGHDADRRGEAGWMGNSPGIDVESRRDQRGTAERSGWAIGASSAIGWLGDAARREMGRARQPWQDSVWLPCLDGKARRIKSEIQPLASGIPNRVGLLRGSGNAITPQTAALFIEAVMDCIPWHYPRTGGFRCKGRAALEHRASL